MSTNPILVSVLLGLTAAAANAFGGAIIVQRHWERRYLKYFIALGSGFMLATALVEMIPESLALRGREALIFVLAGYLVVHFFEHTLAPHFHFGEETHADEFAHPHRSYSVLLGLMIHAFFDGIAIGVLEDLPADGDELEVAEVQTTDVATAAGNGVLRIGSGLGPTTL